MKKTPGIAKFIGGALLTMWLCSCGSYKSLIYFQDVDTDGILTQKINNYNPAMAQPGDILQVSLTSANPAATAAFNNTPGGSSIAADNNKYIVDQAGFIEMPVLGKIKVGGLTVAQIHNMLIPLYTPYLKDSFVDVQLANFKISVLGDVAHPGVFNVDNERINVLEALSRAGDLDATANRNFLLLIRETNGERKIIPLDLTSSKVLESPYYYLKSNDILYIEPGKAKYATVSSSSRTLPIVLSAISVVAIIIALFKN